MATVAELLLKLLVDDKATPAMNTAGGAAKTMSVNWRAAAAVVAGAGATVMGALSSAANKAADFDLAMREVNTLINLSEDEYAALSKQTRDLSAAMGVDATASAKALYQAISAGVPKENAMEFLAVASRAAIGGVTDAETAVDGLSTVLNAFKMDSDEAQRVADIMFTTVKQGKTDFTQLSNSLFNVAPLAATAGVSFEEASAAIATLTKQGTPTSVATTQIRAAMQGLLKPSADITAIFQSLGYESASAAIKSEGLQFALNAVREATGGDVGQMQTLLGSVEAVAAALGTTGSNAEMFAGDLAAMQGAAGASTTAFEEMNKSSRRWGDRVRAQFQNITIAVGEFLGPAQGTIAMLPGLSAGFSGAAAAVGFLTGEQAKNVAGLIGHRAASLASTAAQSTMTAAQWLLNAALSANPIGLVVLAIGALVAAFAIAWASSEDFRRIVTGAFDATVNTIRTAVNSILGFINSLIRAWNGLELSLPGFKVDLPGGNSIGWEGVTLGTPNLPEIPLLDRGGIVTRPTLALLAGNGIPEAVIPLGSGGVAGVTWTGNLIVQGSVIAERDLTTVIRDELRAMVHRGVEVGLL